MVKRFFDKGANKTRIGFLTAFSLLLLSFILTYISTQKVIEQAGWIDHNNKVTHQLDKALNSILGGESSFRQYIISGSPQAFNDYEQSVTRTDTALSKLKLLFLSREQQDHVVTLQTLLDQKHVQ